MLSTQHAVLFKQCPQASRSAPCMVHNSTHVRCYAGQQRTDTQHTKHSSCLHRAAHLESLYPKACRGIAINMPHNHSNVELSQSSGGMTLKSVWGGKQGQCTMERARSSSVRSRVSCTGSRCAASSSSHSAIEAADLLRDFPPGTAGPTRLFDSTHGCSQMDPPREFLAPTNESNTDLQRQTNPGLQGS